MTPDPLTQPAKRLGRPRLPDTVVQRAAEAAKVARADGYPTVAAVMSACSVSEPAAKKYLCRARERGFLKPGRASRTELHALNRIAAALEQIAETGAR